MAYRLKPTKRVGRALLRVIRKEARKAGRRATARGKLSASDRVHRARTGCKKIRATLRLIRSPHPRLYARENRFFRDCAHALAPIRDAGSLPGVFEGLVAHNEPQLPHRGFGGIRHHLARQRRRMAGDPKGVERSLASFARRMRSASRRLKRRRLTKDGFSLVIPDLRHSYARARRRCRKARKRRGEEAAFHRWRKAVKALAYQCRLLCEVWDSTMVEWRQRCERLSDLLGEHQDLALLRAWLGKAENRDVDAVVLARALELINAQQEKLRTAAAAAGGALFAQKAKAWIRRLKI